MVRGPLVTLMIASAALGCDGAPTRPEAAADARSAGDAALVASAAGPSVTGGGTITFGASKEHVSVAVFGTSGTAQFHDNTVVGNVNGHVEINCVRIVANEATLSGIITRSNDPTIEGWEALFQIRDNGQGGRGEGPDLMSPVLLHEVGIGPDCLVPRVRPRAGAGELPDRPVARVFRGGRLSSAYRGWDAADWPASRRATT
jgi:hypothetical protein